MASEFGLSYRSKSHRSLQAAGALTVVFFFLSVLSGCAGLVSTAAGNLSENMSLAIADNDDIATVEAGVPAYLLMMDGMVQGDPDNSKLLTQAAGLYSTYSGAFAKDRFRDRKLSTKALNYALRAACASNPNYCSLRAIRFQPFEELIAKLGEEDVPVFYTLGTAWAGWIRSHRDDFNAVAELSRVETIMQKILALDEFYKDGGAHLYLGTLAILLPPALGGKPDVARRHFERAIEISEGKNLMAKVVYARQYARMVYDRQLHDRLLREVLDANPDQPGYVLANTLAQQQARVLLDEAGDYF